MEILTGVNKNEVHELTTFQAFKSLIRLFYCGIGSKCFWREFSYMFKDGCISIEAQDSNLLQMIAEDRIQSEGSVWMEAQKAIICMTGSHDREGRVLIDMPRKSLSIELSGMGEAEYEIFQEALESFFYAENPLCAEVLFDGGEVAVCCRSDEPIPEDIIMPSGFWPEGIIFSGKAIYAIPIPYVLSIPEYPVTKEDGRDPDPLEVLKYAIGLINADCAEDILFSMRERWKASSEIDDAWYALMCALINKASESDVIKAHFREHAPYLICVGYIDGKDTNRIKRREIAESWLSRQPQYEVVMEHFRLLGVPTIEAVCAEQGGFAGTEFEDPED